MRTSSYGTGTFILGAGKALDWIGAATTSAGEAADPAEDEPADLQARIKALLEARAAEAQDRAKQAADNRALEEGLTPQEWWDQNGSDDRARWLSAWYAEFSGHLNVVRARPRPCRHCDGTGDVTLVNERGEVVRDNCPVCKGLQFERLVNYR